MDADQASAAGQPPVSEQASPFCEKCDEALHQWYQSSKPRTAYAASKNQFSENAVALHGVRGTMGRIWKFEKLEPSAQSCQYCNFILQVLGSSPWIPLSDYDYVEVNWDHISIAPRTTSTPDVDKKVGGDYYCRPQIKCFNKKHDFRLLRTYASEFTHIYPLVHREERKKRGVLSNLFSGRVVGTTVDFSLVRLWYDICCKKHYPTNLRHRNGFISNTKSCCPASGQLIPHFRLIDVVKQCVTTPEPLAQYAALSYVWGTAKRLLLCADNLPYYATPGALSRDNPEVPTTFKDALVVAAELGIQYIWIDALCILQDNEVQLQEHTSRMDSIYGSAVVTIVSDTDSADSGIPGISIPRGPTQLTFNYNNTLYINSKRTLNESMADSPWEKRAWCFQEKVFSKRLLILSSSQAFYYCQRTTYSEDLILETKDDIDRDMSTRSEVSDGRLGYMEPCTRYKIHASRLPNDISSLSQLIESYSQRQLSFETGSIRAFRGVLSFAEARVGPAIWGIPRLWFKEMIIWCMKYNPELRRANFPSWSWAGWRGNLGSKVPFEGMPFYGDPPDYGVMWPIDWMYHQWNEIKLEYELVPVHYRASKAQLEREHPWYLSSHPGSSSYRPNPPFPPVLRPLPFSSYPLLYQHCYPLY